MDRLGFRKLLLNFPAGIKVGSGKSTVIRTKMPVRYRRFLASAVCTLHLCLALTFRVYRVSMVQSFGFLQRSWNSVSNFDGFVLLEEAPYLLDGLVNVLLRILPRIHGHLGVRGQASDLHRDLVWVGWYVIGGYQ